MPKEDILKITRLLSYSREQAGMTQDYNVAESLDALIDAVKIIANNVVSNDRRKK